MDAENCLLLYVALLNRVLDTIYIYTIVNINEEINGNTTMENRKNLYLSRDPETLQKRNCLRCEKLFLSEHIGNRLCPRCEKRS